MNQVKFVDRLQPALLDRLTDDDPQDKKADELLERRLAFIDKDVKERVFAAADALYEDDRRRDFPTAEAVSARVEIDISIATLVLRKWRRAQAAQAGPLVVNRTRLREAVLRDLSWLFNTTAPSNLNSDTLDHVRRSVLNYGLPPMSGQCVSDVDVSTLERNVHRAISDMEPRILPGTLKVEAMVSGKQIDHHNQLSLRISGQLWAQPVPLELMLHTDIDLETGRVAVKDLAR